MLCVHQAIKGLAELVTIVKWDEILSPSLYVLCSRDKSVSPSNHLVTRHRLNDHQRCIVVQGDGDHDLCTGGSYAEATVVLTSTQVSWSSNRQRTRTADSRVEVQGDGADGHYIGG
jgi:hypothetical protein